MLRAPTLATLTVALCGCGPGASAPRAHATGPAAPVAAPATVATAPAPPAVIHVTGTVLTAGAPWTEPPLVVPAPAASAPPAARETWSVVPIPGGRPSLPRLPVVVHGTRRFHFPQLGTQAASDLLAQRVTGDGGLFGLVRTASGRCELTLARPNLVSFLCTATGYEDDEGPLVRVKSVTYRVDGDVLHEVPLTDAFVPGARIDRVVARACDWFPARADDAAPATPDTAVPPAEGAAVLAPAEGAAAAAPAEGSAAAAPAEGSAAAAPATDVADVDDETLTSDGRCGVRLLWAASLGPDGLHASMGDDGTLTDIVVPWGDLTAVIRPDGPLAAVPGALHAAPDAHAAVIAHAATPGDPEHYCVLTGPLTWSELAHVAEHLPIAGTGRQLLAVAASAGHAELALRGDCHDAGTLPAALALRPVERDVDRTPLSVLPTEIDIGAPAPLRATPGGAVVATLPPWTFGYAVHGARVDGVDSHDVLPPVPADAQTFFVTARGPLGWTASSGIAPNGGTLLGRNGGVAARAAFARTVPVELRDDVMSHTTAGLSTADASMYVFVGESTTTHATFVARYATGDSSLLALRLDGAYRTVATVRASYGVPGMLVAATRVAADPPGIERWIVYADGHAAPVFAAPLATAADAPAADAVSVELGSEVPTWTPLRVKHGQDHVDYTWNGTSLVAR